MTTKTQTKKFETKKGTYAAKLETIRRKEVRNHKQSFNKARSSK